jgi:hypothetical protein
VVYRIVREQGRQAGANIGMYSAAEFPMALLTLVLSFELTGPQTTFRHFQTVLPFNRQRLHRSSSGNHRSALSCPRRLQPLHAQYYCADLSGSTLIAVFCL